MVLLSNQSDEINTDAIKPRPAVSRLKALLQGVDPAGLWSMHCGATGVPQCGHTTEPNSAALSPASAADSWLLSLRFRVYLNLTQKPLNL
jgi:hypothetical protein